MAIYFFSSLALVQDGVDRGGGAEVGVDRDGFPNGTQHLDVLLAMKKLQKG